MAEGLRIVIVEDEPAPARQLVKTLESMDDLLISSLVVCGDIKEGKIALKKGADLLFLDLNLRGASGFDLLKDFVAESFETIITTAYPEHALKAFELGARDYLVKPFSKERVKMAISRIPSAKEPDTPPMKNVVVKNKDGYENILIDKIVAVFSAGDYTELHLVSGARKLSSRRMDFLEHRLSGEFFRVHRGAIVRLDKVVKLLVESGGKYSLTVEGIDGKIAVGRGRYKELKGLLKI